MSIRIALIVTIILILINIIIPIIIPVIHIIIPVHESAGGRGSGTTRRCRHRSREAASAKGSSAAEQTHLARRCVVLWCCYCCFSDSVDPTWEAERHFENQDRSRPTKTNINELCHSYPYPCPSQFV